MKFVHVKENGEKIFCEALTKADIDYCKNSPRWKEVNDSEEESIPEAVIAETIEEDEIQEVIPDEIQEEEIIPEQDEE
jgi:hypothetical protein